MAFKIGSTHTLEFDPRLLAGESSRFWVPQDIDSVPLNPIIGLDGSGNSIFSTDPSYRIKIAANGRLTLSGSINTSTRPPSVNYNRASLTLEQQTFVERWKGYPVRLNVFSRFKRSGPRVFAGLDFRLWLGDFVDEGRTEAALLTHNGQPAIIPMGGVEHNQVLTGTSIVTTDASLLPPWVQPSALVAQASDNYPEGSGIYTILTYEGGNRPVFDSDNAVMVMGESSYVITSPGRMDADGKTQLEPQGSSTLGTILLNTPTGATEPEYTGSALCRVQSSDISPNLINPTTNVVEIRGSHSLVITVFDRNVMGLTNISPNITQSELQPLRINNQPFFIDTVSETEDDSLDMILTSNR